MKLLPIERLLWIAEAYVLGVEELHITPRTILPHGASFHGYPLTLTVRCEALHQEFNVLVRSHCLCVPRGWGGGAVEHT